MSPSSKKCSKASSCKVMLLRGTWTCRMTASRCRSDGVWRQRLREGRGVVNTEAEVIVICSSLLRSLRGARCRDVRCSVHRIRPSRKCRRGRAEADDALHDRQWDVGDGAEPVAVGKHLLGQRHELGPLGQEESDRVDEVVGADVVGIGLVEIEEGVSPDHEDRGVLELELVEFDLGVSGSALFPGRS